MSVITEALRNFFSSKGHGPTNQQDLFEEIDLDYLEEQLKISEKAKEFGTRNQPSEFAMEQDSNERRIIHSFEKKALSVSAEIAKRITRYNQDIRGMDVDGLKCDAEALPSALDAEYNAILAQERPVIQRSFNHRAAIENQFNLFRKENGLVKQEPASKDSHILGIGVLIIIIIVEGVLNGFFFAEGLSGGRLAGMQLALGLALINVMVAFLIGLWAIPQKNHVSVINKSFGLMSLVAYPVIAIFINLFIAHFRDAHISQQLHSDIGRLALESFQAAPFYLLEAQSWMLVGIGLLFSLIALIDGYRWNDPYPGYSRIHQRLQKAIEDYDDDKEKFLQLVDKRRKDSLELLKRMDNKFEHFKGLTGAFGVIINDYFITWGAYKQLLESGSDTLLHRYRDENTVYRTDPAPAHFSKQFRFPDTLEIEVPKPTSVEEVEYQRQKVIEAERTINKVSESIQRSYASTLNNLDNFLQDLNNNA